jgi:3-methylfumaryl-CoA hydratase
MWAGSRLAFHEPLLVGDPARRESEIVSVEPKTGRSGSLVFVLVRHRIFGPRGLAIEDEHDIVYREAPTPGAAAPPAPPAPADAAWRREIRPDPVLLFRYSALTFNSHRIHYDHPYVTGIEGYSAVIVHGPLIATLLLDLVRREARDRVLSRFEFKALSPLYMDRPFTVSGRPDPASGGAQVWAAGPDGLAMTASARFRA